MPTGQKDTAYLATLAGAIGAVVVDGLTLLERLAGVPTRTPWEVGARVFLRSGLAKTAGGILFGLIISLAMSITGAFLLALFFQVFGEDHAVLKGVLVFNALGLVTLGLLAPILGIAPLLRGDLTTHFVAVINLSLLGAVEGGLMRRLRAGAPRRAG